MKRLGIKNLLVIVVGIFLAVVCIFLDAYVTKQKKEEELRQNQIAKEYVKEEMPEAEKAMLGTILYEDEEVVCYVDRAFLRFRYLESDVTRVRKLVDGMLQACPSIEKVCVVPVPHRVFIEEGYEEDKKAYERYLQSLSFGMPAKGVVVNVLSEIQQHKDEDVFYRSANSWSPTGAYYGTQMICRELGIESIPLDRYYRYSYSSFRGGVLDNANLAFTQEIESIKDKNFYYLLPNSPNMAEVIKKDDNGKKISYKKPIITSSARNIGAFIENIYIRAIIPGEAKVEGKEGKYVLLVCDNAGKQLAPYLKDYYDGVYVINIYYDSELYMDINEIIETYHISEVVYAQNAMDMGNFGYTNALNSFYKEW